MAIALSLQRRHAPLNLDSPDRLGLEERRPVGEVVMAAALDAP
jgi:hypothetical protein